MSDDARKRYLDSMVAMGQEARKQGEPRFEHVRVKRMLTHLKLKHALRPIGQLWEQRTGRFELRFEAFNEYFPDFPFRIGCSTLTGMAVPWSEKAQEVEGEEVVETKTSVTPSNYAVHMDPHAAEPSRYRKFRWVPYVIAYEQFYDSVASAAELRRIALVFPRKGFTDGMVLHNDDSEKYWTSGLAEVYKYSGKTGEHRLYKVPFSSLLDEIYAGGRGWRPKRQS